MIQKEKPKKIRDLIFEEVQGLAIKTNHKMQESFIGSFKSAFSGEGLNFKESKIYSDGDNVKNIDWKTSAKTGKIFVKKFEEERRLKINLIIDSSVSLNTGFQELKKNKLIESVALIVFSAMKTGDKVSLKIIGENPIGKDLKPFPTMTDNNFGSGKNHSYKILEKLIIYFESGLLKSPDLDLTKKFFDEENFSKNSKGKSIYFFFSDFENEEFLKGIKKINTKNERICVFIRDNLDSILGKNDSKNGISEFKNFENLDEKILIDWKNFSEFKKFLDEKIFEKRKDLAKFGIESLEIFEGKNVMDNFIEFFRIKSRKS